MDDAFRKNFAERLRGLRLESNMTQKDLAELLGKAESTVRMWELEKSEPDMETLQKIVSHFDVTLDYLLGLCPYKNLPKEVEKERNKDPHGWDAWNDFFENAFGPDIAIMAERFNQLRELKGVTLEDISRRTGATIENLMLLSEGVLTNMPPIQIMAIASSLETEYSYLAGLDIKHDNGAEKSPIDNIYLELAQEMQDNNINPADLRLALEAIRNVRKDEKNN